MRVLIDKTLIDLYVQIWNEKNHNNKSLKEYARQLTREKINFGWCYQFALVIQGVYGGIILSSYDDDHVWVRIAGRDYDSDHVKGLKDMDKYGDAIEQDRAELDVYWGLDYGRSGPVQDEVIELTINTYLKRQTKVAA